MASQILTLVTIGGTLGEDLWNQAQHWSAQRLTDDPNEWSSEQWPATTRSQIDTLTEQLLTHGVTPPVLYRSQHVDLWSMGDVYQSAMAIGSIRSPILLMTERFELYLCRVTVGDKIPRNPNETDEYRWLERRLEEAVSAWAEFSDSRVLLLIRDIIGGTWEDHEIEKSLNETPTWWPRPEEKNL